MLDSKPVKKPVKNKKIIVESKTKEELQSEREKEKDKEKNDGGFFDIPQNKKREFDEDLLDKYSDYEVENKKTEEKEKEKNKTHFHPESKPEFPTMAGNNIIFFISLFFFYLKKLILVDFLKHQ